MAKILIKQGEDYIFFIESVKFLLRTHFYKYNLNIVQKFPS